MINAAAFAIACVPLGFYLLGLGMINLRRRPLMLRGAVDAASLAAAVSGMIIVGPLNLFMPESGAIRYGPYVWALLALFYVLCVLLYILTARPRLVIFNVTRKQLWPVLEQVVRRLDSDARLAGDAVHLPQLVVQFHLESAAAMRSVSLVATGDQQSFSHWRRLHSELAAALENLEVPPNPRGFTLLAAGVLLLGWPLVQLLRCRPKRWRSNCSTCCGCDPPAGRERKNFSPGFLHFLSPIATLSARMCLIPGGPRNRPAAASLRSFRYRFFLKGILYAHAEHRYRQYWLHAFVLQPGDAHDAGAGVFLRRAGEPEKRAGHHDSKLRIDGLDDRHLVAVWFFAVL